MRTLSSSLLLLGLLSSMPILAQEAQVNIEEDPASDRARALYTRATLAFEAEDWAEAATLYERAHALAPHPELLYNLALSQERSLQDEAALATYREFIGATQPDAPKHEEAITRANTLETRLRGVHSAEDESTLPATEPSSALGPALVLGLGAVSLATAIATLTARLVIRGELNDECGDGMCEPQQHARVDRYDRLGATSWILLGVGAAATATGLVLLTTRDRSGDVSFDGRRLLWRGRF